MKNRKNQKGVMLLESLMGLLVFSFGILALIGMQANAIRNTTETKYRSDASFLTSQIMSTMWADKANLNDYVYNGAGGIPSKLTTWVNNVKNTLPGVISPDVSNPDTTMSPQISISSTIGNTREVTIRIHWLLPGSSSRRTYSTVTYVTN